MRAAQFTAAMKRKRDAILREILSAENQTINETQAMFVRASSGTISTKTLRLMGHPYAKRDPQTPLNPAVINKQSGAFKRDWRKARARMAGGVIRGSVVNVDPKAVYMLGTTKMVQRPIDVAVANTMKPRRLSLLRNALARALRA